MNEIADSGAASHFPPKLKPAAGKRIKMLTLTPLITDFVSQPKYSLDLAKSYRHSLKLTDRESLKKLEKMKSFFSHSFAPPADELIVTLNHSLNKLTPEVEKIHKVSEKLIHSNFFGTENFIITFCQRIVEAAVDQNQYAPVYTRFLQEIYIGLPTEGQRKMLYDKLSEKIVLNADAPNPGQAFFTGCLVSASLIDPRKVMDFVNQLIRKKTTDSLETVFNLLIFSGEILEQKYPEFENVINELTKATCNEEIKSRVRFLIGDLLDERLAGWKTDSLLPNIAQIKEQQKETTKEQKASTLLKEYILDGYLPDQWSIRFTYDLMHSLELSSMKEYDKGIEIFSILIDRKEQIFQENAILCLNKARKEVDDPKIIQEYPYAVRTAGAIFAQLIVLGNSQPNVFGTDCFPFNPDVFIGFVDELDRIGRVDVIQDSKYLSDLQFIPQPYPHSFIVSDLNDINLTSIFPVYDAMSELFHLIENESNAEDVAKFLNFDLDRKLAKNKKFVEFVTEVIVIHRPKYQCLIEFIANRPMETLSHVESLGEFYKWKPEQTAANIRKLSGLICAEMEEFKKLELRPFHSAVVRYL